MLTREALAKRLREARRKKGMTLKEVEKLSGFSSTHISEIERGRTTPTIDALVRIARALDRDPCYFIEERELDEVCLISAEEGAATPRPVLNGAAQLRRLTGGILGGRLAVCALDAAAPGSGALPEIGAGDLCVFVERGRVRIIASDQEYPLAAGASMHTRLTQSPGIRIEEAPARVLLITDPEAGCGR